METTFSRFEVETCIMAFFACCWLTACGDEDGGGGHSAGGASAGAGQSGAGADFMSGGTSAGGSAAHAGALGCDCPPPASGKLRWLGPCSPVDLSDDGQTALAREGLWREQDAGAGWLPIPDLPNTSGNIPFVLSADGRVVYGVSGSKDLYRFTADEGVEALGVQLFPSEHPLGTTADGSRLVGCTYLGLVEWTRETGFTPLDQTEETCAYGTALLSANGATIVADTEYGPWLRSSAASVSPVTLSSYRALCSAISGDGTRYAINPRRNTNARSYFPGEYLVSSETQSVMAERVSDLDYDGRISVGSEQALLGDYPFYRDETVGIQHVSDALFDHGVVADVTPRGALAISGDGRTLFGVATRRDEPSPAHDECFIATFGDERRPAPSRPLPHPPASCGNGVLDPDEQCDDGNANNGDACSDRCRRALVFATERGTFARTPNGSVAVWGESGRDLLGGGSADAWSPRPVPALAGSVQMASNAGCSDGDGTHACAVLENGRVLCWGVNVRGQLGNGRYDDSLIPVEVAGIASAVGVAVGGDHACALLAGGTVACWGDNSEHQLGEGISVGDSPVPLVVPGVAGVVQLEANKSSTCALLSDTTVWCWGIWPSPQVGANGLVNVRQISACGDWSCQLLLDGRVWCGFPVPLLDRATQLSTAFGHVCALLANGAVQCLGDNWYGQLGNGDRHPRKIVLGPFDDPNSSPAPSVIGIGDAIYVTAGGDHSCALLASGELRCWGLDYSGELGIGFAFTNYPNGLAKPVTVHGL